MGQLLGKHKKILGILGLLIVICGFTAALAPDSFLKAANIENTVRWTALFGIISIGVAFVIMTGGIDLSIGSVIALVGCVLAMGLSTEYVPDRLTEVTQADPATRQVVLERDVDINAGESVLFSGKVYDVEAAAGERLTLQQALTAGDKIGSLQAVAKVTALSDEDAESVRRGTIDMGLRTLTVAGSFAASRGDLLNLIYAVGLPQTFTVQRVSATPDATEIVFFVRRGQQLRLPDAAFVAVRSQALSTPVAISLAMFVSLAIGLIHGLLITKVKLQPFVVTLCGLLIYRGVARFMTGDREQGFGSEYPFIKSLAKGDFLQLLTGREFALDIPMPFIYMLILAIVAAIFLNKTIFGRYILALGRNEEAARYSGINTDRMVILSYMICSFCAGIAAILFALDLNSIQPSGHGNFYELYAIAAAVLGGCSLRGGEGSILGVVIAAAVMRVLNNAINLIDGIDTSTEFAIIGLVILLGVTVDETVRRIAARRKA